MSLSGQLSRTADEDDLGMSVAVPLLHPQNDGDTVDLANVSPSLGGAANTSATYLVAIGGAEPRILRAPADGTWSIGRARDAALHVEGESISRRHALLTFRAGVAELHDLGSQNGTTLNGRTIHESAALKSMDVVGVGHASFVVCSPSELPTIATVYAELERLARSELPVHIFGETGTGKELAARAIHAWSSRATESFVAVNCAALPEALVESELFGHERGAFSGAHNTKIGVFEAADGGTLLFDEIGELPLAAQAKLLRVLETRRIVRVGDAGLERRVDVRIVSSTNRDLSKEVAAGRFRQDLYYRLSTACVHLPALRDRKAEVVAFARSFLNDARRRVQAAPCLLDARACERLVRHDWPGNVRELRNLMEWLAVVCPESEMCASMLEARLASTPEISSAPESRAPEFRAIDDEVRELETARMRAALAASNGNKKAAAALISMPRRTFLTKLKVYGIV